MRAGIKILEEDIGSGREATRDCRVTISYQLSLNHGDVIQEVDSFSFLLRDREVIAALRYGVEGMRVGGIRRFKAPPHLAYREPGIPGIVPPNAVLTFAVTLLAVGEQE